MYARGVSRWRGQTREVNELSIAPEDEPSRTYTVMVDDNFHYQDTDYRTEIPGFASAQEALAECKRIVDACLAECAEPGRGAAEIYARYQSFGEDPWVPESRVRFSAWDYAKKNANRFVR